MLALKSMDGRHGWRRLPAVMADLLLPPVCPGCGAAISAGHALCAACWSSVRFIAPPLCPVTGAPFAYEMGEGIVSAEALADPPPFRRARAAVHYEGVARRLVHQLKYHDRLHVAEVIARAMQRAGQELLAETDLIVPVPLYRWRLLRRRFNQSALLAQKLAKLSRTSVNLVALQRIKATKQQVGLTANQRAENVRGAFRVAPSMQPALARAQVLLVDDVYTSGATVKAASRALLRAGAASVDVLTFARVLR